MKYVKEVPITVGRMIGAKNYQLAYKVFDIAREDYELRIKLLEMDYVKFIQLYGK